VQLRSGTWSRPGPIDSGTVKESGKLDIEAGFA
jgi:hypothetical protein